jgi:hypothetical protein
LDQRESCYAEGSAAAANPEAGPCARRSRRHTTESALGRSTTEVIHRKSPWRHLEAVEFATLTWGDWFNTRRLLEPIGYVPPAEYEAQYYAQASGVALSGNPTVNIEVDTTAADRLQGFLSIIGDDGVPTELNA